MGLFTILYLKAIQPNLVKKRTADHYIIINNTIDHLKRLNINVIRPNINTCFADFTSNGKDFLYALGAIKNVGHEAISNEVKEKLIKNTPTTIGSAARIEGVTPAAINLILIQLKKEELIKQNA